MASEYDAVLLGKDAKLNRAVIEAGVSRERHRSLVVVAAETDQLLLRSLGRRAARRISVVAFEDRVDGGSLSKVVRLGESPSQGVRRSQLGAFLATVARMQVSSVLALPGLFEPDDPANFEQLDKLTLAVPRAGDAQTVASRWSFGNNIEFDLEDATAVETAGYIELTGYPSLRGVA
jgi:hypothetical protein